MKIEKEDSISINILCISDIHSKLKNVEKLEKYIQKIKYIPDYIFCLGDFASIPKCKNDDEENIEDIEKSEVTIKIILNILEKICKKIIYIPGNHDPDVLFNNENSKKLSENSINLHKNYIKIADDLVVFGVGGSTASIKKEKIKGYFKYDFKNFQAKKYCYPYNKENLDYEKGNSLFVNDIKDTYNKIIDQYNNLQYILLSHQGPLTSNTCYSFTNNGDYSGSYGLDKFIVENNKNILCNIHGHAHKSWGMCLINDVPIINLGSIKFDSFGTILIEKSNKTNNKWKIISVEKMSLD